MSQDPHIPEVSHIPEDPHILNPKETYLFSNCTRHADTLAVILGVPAAALGKVLLQRKLPAANPYLVGFTAGIPAFLATYLVVSPLYFSKVCWGYMRFLPEESVLKEKLCVAEKRYDTWNVPYNRTRALQDVMLWDRQCKMDWDTELTEVEYLQKDEVHEIQKQLRRVPSEDYRLVHRIREHLKKDENVMKYLEKLDRVSKTMFGAPPAMKDERLKNAAKPMSKAA